MTNTTEPLVTVALSVYNGGPVLAQSVQSILDQSWNNWELLILDDGSTDGAIDSLPCLADPRIKVVRDGLNKGLSARLNQAVSMASGQYLARMDHDDLSHPERFAQQIAFLEQHPDVDLLATQCATMDESGKLNGVLPHATRHEDLCGRPWLNIPMPHPSWMGRIDWFRAHPYQDPGPYCCEDQELLLRAHRFSRYHMLPMQLLSYRVREHTSWRKQWRTRKALFGVQARYFLRHRAIGAIALAFVATLLRVGRDAVAEIRYRLPG